MRKIKYPLIFSDFDGTLATSKGAITEENKKAVQEYIAAGGKFVLSTGRLSYGSKHIVDELQLKGLWSCGNGAQIINLETGETLLASTIPNETVVEICQAMEEMGLHIHVYELDQYYCNMDDEALKLYMKAVRVQAKLVLDKPISQFAKEKELSAVKVMAVLLPEKVDMVMEKLKAKNFKNCAIVRSGDHLIEVISNNFSKGTALEFIAKYYGIPLEQTIAIGDQNNDVPMIEKAGIGFAVKSADESLKKVARVSEYTNDENAVAHIIEEYGFME